MGEENYPNLEKICRLCLKEEKFLIDIFAQSAEVQMSIPLRIMVCVGVEVQPSDRLPKRICLECRYQLEKSYYFQKRSQLSESKLRKHIRLLSLGKKSRVFDKYEDNDFDVFLLEDSIRFLQETEELREKQTNSAWNEIPQTEPRKDVAEVKQDWTRECNDMLRYECTAMANLELWREVFGEYSDIKPLELLNDLEDYIRSEGESHAQNFSLLFSEINCPDPILDSYHLENSGEIQHYKRPEQITNEGDVTIEAATQFWNNVLAFNFEEKMDGENISNDEIKGAAPEQLENTNSLITKFNGTTFTESLNNGNVLNVRNRDTAKKLKCNLCPMELSTQNLLDRHLRTHKKIDFPGVSFQCSECFIYVSSKSALKRHILLHSGQRPYVCEECGKSFVRRDLLMLHKKNHNNVKAHKCLHCPRTFSQKNSLTNHMNRLHSKVPELFKQSCHLCPKSFNHASGLSRHLLKHKGFSFQCKKCERKFTDRCSIKRHIVNVHGVEREDNVKKYYQEETNEIAI